MLNLLHKIFFGINITVCLCVCVPFIHELMFHSVPSLGSNKLLNCFIYDSIVLKCFHWCNMHGAMYVIG